MCIRDMDPDMQDDMWGNIILAGGSTMFPGFAGRLGFELNRLRPRGTTVRIIAPAKRKYSVWIGGSMLGSLCTLPYSWITRADYDDKGPGLVNSRFH